jgi:hypothetical protein
VAYYIVDGENGPRFLESSGGRLPLPEGAVEVTEEEYQQRLGELRAVAEERAAEFHRDAEEQAGGDVAALVAAGVSEETAARLAGRV